MHHLHQSFVFYKTHYWDPTSVKRALVLLKDRIRTRLDFSWIQMIRPIEPDTSQNGDKSKTATHPKRQQIQNNDTSKTATTKRVHVAVLVCHCFGCVVVLACHRFGYNQNGDKSKTATRLNSDDPTYPKRCVDLYPKRCMSPFRCVAVLDTTKTATHQNGLVCCCFGCRRFGLSPFLLVLIEPNRPFLQSLKFGLFVLAWAESAVSATDILVNYMGRIIRPGFDPTCNLMIFLTLGNILYLAHTNYWALFGKLSIFCCVMIFSRL